jgi:hypothetical protein
VSEIISMNEKKVVPWSEGLVVFITKEAKKFGWNGKTKIRVTATKDRKVVVEEVKSL